MALAQRPMLGPAIAFALMVAGAVPQGENPSSVEADAEGFRVIRRETSVPLAAANHSELARALSDLRRTQGWHGQTAIVFEQTAELVRGDSGCRIAGLSTTLTVTVTLPRLDLRAASHSPAFERRWQASIEGLRLHEEGHVAIGIDGARGAHDRLSASGPFADCREARRALMREELRFRHRQAMLHQRYDQRTDFGLPQAPLNRAP